MKSFLPIDSIKPIKEQLKSHLFLTRYWYGVPQEYHNTSIFRGYTQELMK